MRRATVLAAVLALAASDVGVAQFWDNFNPSVTVNLNHPPGYGLKLTRVAFAPAHGRCSNQLLDPITALFVDSGVEVVDRQHLDTILAEHQFNTSGYVDPQQAAELGRMLGSGVLLFLRVTRCETERKATYRDEDDGKKGTRRTNIATTTVELKGSLQVVDLATGRVLKAQPLESSPSRQVESDRGKPEFPPENDVLDEAVADVVNNQVRRLFFPWSETQDLIYYDDKDCGMKLAYQLLKSGDHGGALRQSLQNVEACKAMPDVKPKYVGRAYYNVGMSYFITGDYDRALESFRETVRLNPGNVVTNAIEQCNRARQMSAELRQYEEQASYEARRAAPAPTPAAEVPRPAASPEERLQKLQQLFKKGLITKSEYEAKKAEIIKEM